MLKPSPSIFFFFLCADDYAFMGSLIIKEVVKDLLSKGLDNGKILLLAGSRLVCIKDLRSMDRIPVFGLCFHLAMMSKW